MKMLLIALFTLLSVNSFARVLPIQACIPKDRVLLERSIEEWKKEEGYNHVWYIKNLQGQVLGYFSTDNNHGIHSEICHGVYIEDITVSSTWYYWDQDYQSPKPFTWRKDAEYRISQDEGLAFFKVIRVDPRGNIKALMRVVGWGDSDRLFTVQAQYVLFEKRR